MTRFLSREAKDQARGRSGRLTVTNAGGKVVPDREKPLVRAGERRLWQSLNSGDRVEVIHNGNYSRVGTVDERTSDGATVWIILDHGLGRIAVTEGDRAALVLIE